jgi:DNA-binding PadR family transcriptional regulator
MNLTRRQEEFVRSLLDLYGELQEPFHYSELAGRLGVSRFTAYDMLRVLEEKGIVTSHYQLDEGRSGPGRSTVVYRPTQRARRILEDVFAGNAGESWEVLKDRLLEQVQQGHLGDGELAHEMLARTPPDEPETLRYCIEVMTVVALNLRRRSGRQILLKQVRKLLASEDDRSCRPGLSLLGGFALGVLAEESHRDQAWEQELLDHVWQYQALLIEMEPAACQRLAQRLRELFGLLAES